MNFYEEDLQKALKSKPHLEKRIIILDSIKLYFRSFPLLFFIIFITNLVYLISLIFNNYSIYIHLINFFIAIWGISSVINAANLKYNEEQTTINHCLSLGKDTHFELLITTVLYLLKIVFGLILLVIPGMYWSIKLSLAPIASVLQKTHLKNPFQISRDFTKGFMLDIFIIFFLLFALLAFLYSLPFTLLENFTHLRKYFIFIINLIFTSYALTLFVIIYNRLEQIKMNENVALGKK
ncbi:hypothetical protein ACFL4A_01260 [bacterium]